MSEPIEAEVVEPTALVKAEDKPLTVEEVLARVHLVEDIVKKVMRPGEHFGIIPGTDKPTILKPGVEKLGQTFNLDPSYRKEITDLGNGHRDYILTCILTNHATGRIWEGIGSCSTMEARFRYRGTEKEFTGDPVPSTYWEFWKTNKPKAQEILGGKGFIIGKNDEGEWMICIKGERLENPDIADTWNSCLKQAEIRAHRHAILTATASSDHFTQDMELGDPTPTKKAERPPSPPTPQSPPRATPAEKARLATAKAGGQRADTVPAKDAKFLISDKQAKRFHAKTWTASKRTGDKQDAIEDAILAQFGLETSEALTWNEGPGGIASNYDAACLYADQYPDAPVVGPRPKADEAPEGQFPPDEEIKVPF